MDKKKIAVCYFSYWKDKEFLNNSLKVLEKTIERHPEYDIKVYVFDDGRCDKHLKKKELNCSPTLITTNFDRKGNLNGFECIDGMFKEYVNIMKKFEFDYVIKLDSDCVLNSLDFIYAVEEELKKNNIPLENLGQIGTFFASICCCGCCSIFTKQGVNTISNLFVLMNRESNQQEKVMKKRVKLGYNEDKVVSVLMEMSPLVRVNLDAVPNVKGNCNAFHYPLEGTNYSEFSSIAFKPNKFADTANWSREFCLELMEKHVKEMCD